MRILEKQLLAPSYEPSAKQKAKPKAKPFRRRFSQMSPEEKKELLGRIRHRGQVENRSPVALAAEDARAPETLLSLRRSDWRNLVNIKLSKSEALAGGPWGRSRLARVIV